MHDYAVFLAGLDAFILDFDGHSSGSPMSNMESTFLDGSCLVNETLSEDVLGLKSRPALGDKTLDYVNGHRRRPSRHSFASTPRRGAHVPSLRPTPRQKPPPSILMKPLPPIPTVSSPIFPDNFLGLGTPESSEPELSWGTSAATPSLPASPATMGHPTLPASPASPNTSEYPTCPTSPMSPMSDIDTTEVLRIFDELQRSPEPSPGPTARRNHPYIPWSASDREHILPPPPVHSEISLATAPYSRPPSRSGAMAPEPLDDYMEPGCWAKTTTPAKWISLTGAVKRSVKRRLQNRKRRAARELSDRSRTDELDTPSPDVPVYALPPPASLPSHLRTRAAFRTPPTPSPYLHPGAPSPGSRLYADSPLAPSFASAGTSTLHEWLAARRRASLEGARTSPREHLTFDEYERRGSWLASGPAGFGADNNADDDEERQNREDAVRRGWPCGFAGCVMHHAQEERTPLAPPKSRRVLLSPSRYGLELECSVPDFP